MDDKGSLTEKELKTLNELKKKHGYERGKEIFYSRKNKGSRDDGSWRVDIEFPQQVKNFSDMCDSLSSRLDAFEARQHQRKPKDVKPRTKDFMQPSNPHPKEVDG